MAVDVQAVHVELADAAGTFVSGLVSAQRVDGTWALHMTGVASDPDRNPHIELDDVQLSMAPDRRIEQAELFGLRVSANDGASLEESIRGWMGAPSEDISDSPPSEPERSGRRLWEHLVEGATVRVHEGTVRDQSGDALTGLSVDVERIAGAQLRTRGRGHPRGEGQLSWDVAFDADSRRIDGPVTLTEVPLSVFVPFLPTSLPLHAPDRTLVTADVRVRTESAGIVEVEGNASIDGLSIESARIASAPVLGISLEVSGVARWNRPEHAVDVERGELRMGGARATLAGRVVLDGERYAVDLRGELPRTPCDAAIHAIPAGLLQDLAQMHLDGRIAASIVAHVDSERLDETSLRFAIDDHCVFTSVPSMADVARFQGPFHHEVLEPDDTVFGMDTGPGTPLWTPIAEISPFLLHAVLAHEDASFFTHRGFAPWAIRDALVRNLRERRYVLGASTITMQLVKNVFLRREKTLARKIQEVLLTWWVESAMTKAQILELYLNVIEYGPSIYGIRNAAAHYFGRSPSELSVAESAFLAMILPNPPSFHEQYDEGALSPAFRRRTMGFVGLLEQRGRIDADGATQGREELASFAFSRDGSRVGPEVLRGGSAQLPIDGFSGFPAVSWTDGPEEASETPTEEPEPDPDDGWEEVWP